MCNMDTTITQEMENSSSQDQMSQNNGYLYSNDEETWPVTKIQKEFKAF